VFKSKQGKTEDRDLMPEHPRQMLDILAKLDNINDRLDQASSWAKEIERKLDTAIAQRTEADKSTKLGFEWAQGIERKLDTAMRNQPVQPVTPIPQVTVMNVAPEPEPAPDFVLPIVLPKITRFIDAFDDVDTTALLKSKGRGISFEDVLLKYLASSKQSNTYSAQSLVKKFRYLTAREVAATLYALRAENKIRAKTGTRYGGERVLFGLPANVLGKDRISLGLVRRILTEQFPSDAR